MDLQEEKPTRGCGLLAAVSCSVWQFSQQLVGSDYNENGKYDIIVGYGNLVPKTPMGKIVTMFYALVGIPLMLIYSATIGSILAKGFKYIYTKLCR